MILPDRLGELLAGLTPDQEDLLEEVLRSPYFHERNDRWHEPAEDGPDRKP